MSAPRKTIGQIVGGWNAEARDREMTEIVKVAVLAERERCARIVEASTKRRREIHSPSNGLPLESCEIAAAIRGKVL